MFLEIVEMRDLNRARWLHSRVMLNTCHLDHTIYKYLYARWTASTFHCYRGITLCTSSLCSTITVKESTHIVPGN